MSYYRTALDGYYKVERYERATQADNLRTAHTVPAPWRHVAIGRCEGAARSLDDRREFFTLVPERGMTGEHDCRSIAIEPKGEEVQFEVPQWPPLRSQRLLMSGGSPPLLAMRPVSAPDSVRYRFVGADIV